MDLTIDELDLITEIQHNRLEHELDAAIAELRPEALIELRKECQVSAARQNQIVTRVERRLLNIGALPEERPNS
jgi:hypothetical protein